MLYTKEIYLPTNMDISCPFLLGLHIISHDAFCLTPDQIKPLSVSLSHESCLMSHCRPAFVTGKPQVCPVISAISYYMALCLNASASMVDATSKVLDNTPLMSYLIV